MHRKIVLVSLVIILALVNWSIYGKEKQLSKGKIVYLALAPVDPRSLMQGDYMALHFRLADDVYRALPKTEDDRRWRHKVAASDGYVVVSLDERNIGSFKRLYHNQALSKNDIVMRYRVRNGMVKFATNAYFFQEGYGKYYRPARYGQFRVDKNGELLLAAVYDKNLNKLEPNEKDRRQGPEAASRQPEVRGQRAENRGRTADDMRQKIKVIKQASEHEVLRSAQPLVAGVQLVPKRNLGRPNFIREGGTQRTDGIRHMTENKEQKPRLRSSSYAGQAKVRDQRQEEERKTRDEDKVQEVESRRIDDRRQRQDLKTKDEG